MPSWIVHTNGYAPGRSGESSTSSDVPGSTMVRVAALTRVKVRLWGRLETFRNVIETGPVVVTTVSAGSKAVVTPPALLIVTANGASGLGLAA